MLLLLLLLLLLGVLLKVRQRSQHDWLRVGAHQRQRRRRADRVVEEVAIRLARGER